ncbi:SDR family oxidoreductase [Meridianimarinicoccus aquatilis]|uniref:SDR family oxidoreductase n=2 Tax=Meridianimarinicoccus aquatilis TaxID=2552766 RepID=A0A4R6AIS3_9RHOB|nr:SDR family oxidoreductase [Fluviibacterium aquatile]
MPGDFLNYDIETFQKVINITLRGVFIVTQIAARVIVENEISGAFVNMSSITAQVAIAAYCARNGGVMRFAKVAALAIRVQSAIWSLSLFEKASDITWETIHVFGGVGRRPALSDQSDRGWIS